MMAFRTITGLLGDSQGRVSLPVLQGPARGLWFRLDLPTRMESAYFFGTYELEITRWLTKVCHKGWTIWDCGTYLGFYTCLFARLVGEKGQVVVFEPDPRNMERTKEHARLNKFNNVQFMQCAVGGPSGEIDFILSNNTNSHIPGAYVGATREDYSKIERVDGLIRVPCLSLDEVYSDKKIPPPDLIKIDIDGAEKEALQYTGRLFREVRPLLMLELHNPECDRAAWEFAQKWNYSLKSLDNGRTLTKAEDVCGTLLCLPD